MLTEKRLLLKNAGKVDPLDIQGYLDNGGYQSLAKALLMNNEALLSIIEKSGLKGRGGAGFPTGIKVKATAQENPKQSKFVVCNADEGEPGTFKDRFVMEQIPHLLIEGIAIASLAVGASQAYVYVRGEYYKSIETLKTCIKQAYSKNILGENIMGSSFSLQLELVPGAGSYLCGEELTLLESLEGKRGYPRIKPPFPAQKGLWNRPTLVNNVETLANLPIIIDIGADAYSAIGTALSSGTKLVCLSGNIKKPGTYEVEMGTSIADIIKNIGKDVPTGETIKAVLLGGAAGTFANINQLDTPLGFAELKQKGLTLGSGAIIVFSDKANMAKILDSIFGFFKHESCGKCVPCRVGTSHIAELWKNALLKPTTEKRKILNEIAAIANDIAASSLCPLGQSPILPIRSFLNNCIDTLE